MVQVPGVRSVITPAEVTMHTVVVDEVYVGVTPDVAVAAGTGGVAPMAVFGSAGKLITFAPAPMLIVTVCCGAAA
jgi:hypothetical protein